MSKHRLELDDEYSFLAYGISCHLKDFRVAWHLNNAFGFNFHRENLEMQDRAGNPHEYSLFKHSDDDNHLHYILINNFSEDIALVREYRQFNLFLLVEGYIDIFDPQPFLSKLRSLETVQLVSAIDAAPLKKLQFLLFEE